MKNTINLRS